MKNKFRCLCIIIIGGIIILFNFSGCFSKSDLIIPPKGMTPLETVQFYFEQWNNKSRNGMNSVLSDEMKDTDSMSYLIYVKLTKSIEETEKHMKLEGVYFSETFPGYIEYSIVEVDFEIEVKRSGFFTNIDLPDGKSIIENSRYVLGKINEDSNWIIISRGFA